MKQSRIERDFPGVRKAAQKAENTNKVCEYRKEEGKAEKAAAAWQEGAFKDEAVACTLSLHLGEPAHLVATDPHPLHFKLGQ